MKVRKLSKRAFRRALRLGHGSAYLHVRAYGDCGVEHDLKEACLRSFVYDPPCNDHRVPWINAMLDNVQTIEPYVEAVRAALLASKEAVPEDYEELLILGSKFFDRGFWEFRGILLDLAKLESASKYSAELSEALMTVASLSGFEIAAKLQIEGEAEAWQIRGLFEDACELFGGKDAVLNFIEERSILEPQMLRYLNLLRLEMAADEHPQKPALTPEYSLEQILDSISTGQRLPRWPYCLTRFGHSASAEELYMILNQLDACTDPVKIRAYLEIFRRRSMPEVSANVVNLLYSKDRDVHRTARNALSLVASPLVREAALNLITDRSQRFVTCAMDLFESNFEVCDLAEIVRALRRLKDPDYLHWSLISLKKIFDNHPELQAPEALIFGFENTPCALCRADFLKKIVASGNYPAQLLFESQWDSYSEVRDIARAANSRTTLLPHPELSPGQP